MKLNNDRPIKSPEEDKLNVYGRYAEKLEELIFPKNKKDFSCKSIALAGRFGVGKTSIVNLLKSNFKERKKKKEKIITIEFEPLKEGVGDIEGIMRLFYFALYRNLTHMKSREKLRKFISAIMPDKLNVNLAGIASADIDLNKKLELIEKKIPDSFCEQMEEINKLLCKEKIKKLIVIADEVDRPVARTIINFLQFCRLIEDLEKCTCLYAFDYSCVVNKLTKEGAIGYVDYKHTQIYLDKIFETLIVVDHDKYDLMDFSRNLMHEESKKFFEGDFEEGHSIMHDDVISILTTPRLIKKFHMELLLKVNYLKRCRFKQEFINFLASLVKYPLLLDNMVKSRRYLDKNKLTSKVKEDFDIEVDSKLTKKELILTMFGVEIDPHKENDKENKLHRIMCSLDVLPFLCDEPKVEASIINFIMKSDFIFVDAFVLKTDFNSLYDAFFEGKIDGALMTILKEGNKYTTQSVMKDIVRSYEETGNLPEEKPNINLLNEIWKRYAIKDKLSFPDIFVDILYISHSNLSIDELINNVPPMVSENVLHFLLSFYGISNINGSYDFDQFNGKGKKHSKFRFIFEKMTMSDNEDKKLDGLNEEELKDILRLWCGKVGSDLEDNNYEWFVYPKCLSVLYRYLQWNVSIQGETDEHEDKLKERIANFVAGFIGGDADNKDVFLMELWQQHDYPKKFGTVEDDIFERLFNNNMTLLRALENHLKDKGEYAALCSIVKEKLNPENQKD